MFLRTNDLNPDDVRIIIRWNKFVAGSSIFIPCVNTHKAVQQLNKIATTEGWKTTVKVVLEDGKLGVRIWRMV